MHASRKGRKSLRSLLIYGRSMPALCCVYVGIELQESAFLWLVASWPKSTITASSEING